MLLINRGFILLQDFLNEDTVGGYVCYQTTAIALMIHVFGGNGVGG